MQLVLSTVKRLEVKMGEPCTRTWNAAMDAWLWLPWIHGYGFTLGCHDTWTGHGANWITTKRLEY